MDVLPLGQPRYEPLQTGSLVGPHEYRVHVPSTQIDCKTPYCLYFHSPLQKQQIDYANHDYLAQSSDFGAEIAATEIKTGKVFNFHTTTELNKVLQCIKCNNFKKDKSTMSFSKD